jgi:predicted transglutaminase-like cysteine proteinase
VKKHSMLALVFALVLGSAGCAQLPDSSASMIVVADSGAPKLNDGPSALPPPGFVSFCMHNLDSCTNRVAAAAPVKLDLPTKALLIQVNDKINNTITYESDMDQFGVANRWSLDAVGGRGDCKDYALAKRQALLAAGISDSNLRIAIVRIQTGELHAVLTVDTDAGNLVLDSLTPEIRPWSQTGYVWIQRQSSGDPLQWVKVASNP